MEVPERSSLEPMPYVMHTRLELEAVVDTSGEQHRRLQSRKAWTPAKHHSTG